MSAFQPQFPSVLESYGVTAEQTTKGIVSDINKFDEGYDAYMDTLNNYQESTDPEEKQTLMEELNEFESDLDAADKAIVKKIHYWDKHKENWGKNMAAVHAARDAKAAEKRAAKEGKPTPETQQIINQHKQAQANLAPTPPHIQERVDAAVAAAGTETPAEEKSNWGMWVLGLGIAVVTLGVGAKYLKKL